MTGTPPKVSDESSTADRLSASILFALLGVRAGRKPSVAAWFCNAGLMATAYRDYLWFKHGELGGWRSNGHVVAFIRDATADGVLYAIRRASDSMMQGAVS
ncbi:DUF6461 domain-containing protein [Rhodococcus sp. IEGM 1381]|uniref:DUF6461 domain-containing protein n=1 Tax=Rhodococcus sp. IEGM 1381 TaxID=3047085 RepID=UPI0032D569AC